MKIENVLNQLPYNGVMTNKLVFSDSGGIILIAIEQGKELTEHKSNTDASILILEGEVIFKINSGKYNMKPNDMFSFKKDEIHAIEAIKNSKLVLIK